MEDIFQKRINYDGNLAPILSQVSRDYHLGQYKAHRVIPFGYEDLNIVLETNQGTFFVKFFAAFRDRSNCQRYIGITTRAIEAGVSHPAFYESPQGFLHELDVGGQPIRLCVMGYIDGKSFYELNLKATAEERKFLVEQAARISRIDLKPEFIYDSWAIVNFLKEYKETAQYLEKEDKNAIAPLVKQFEEVEIKESPHSLVHGDIIKTNVLKDSKGKLYIIDFSVANYYPRIQELAVLLCNMLFDEDNPASFKEYYQAALDEYQKHIKLTPVEISSLPLFVKVAHAMHILGAIKARAVEGNTSEENTYWLMLGRAGLRFSGLY